MADQPNGTGGSQLNGTTGNTGGQAASQRPVQGMLSDYNAQDQRDRGETPAHRTQPPPGPHQGQSGGGANGVNGTRYDGLYSPREVIRVREEAAAALA